MVINDLSVFVVEIFATFLRTFALVVRIENQNFPNLRNGQNSGNPLVSMIILFYLQSRELVFQRTSLTEKATAVEERRKGTASSFAIAMADEKVAKPSFWPFMT